MPQCSNRMSYPFLLRYAEPLISGGFECRYDEERDLCLSFDNSTVVVAAQIQSLALDTLTLTEKTGEPTDRD